MLKKSVLLVILFCLSSSGCLAQTPDQTSPSKDANVSDQEWKTLTDALFTEDWEKAAFFSSLLVDKIKTDDEKKQLARLRYFYLYSLAGKFLELSETKQTVKKDATLTELKKAAENFTGKEFLMPPRQYLSDCEGRVNYICAVKDNEKALRVTATNKDATAIISFDYVLFDTNIDLKQLSTIQAFLGGTLQKVEFNNDPSKPWIMRLIFEKGFVRAIVSR